MLIGFDMKVSRREWQVADRILSEKYGVTEGDLRKWWQMKATARSVWLGMLPIRH